MKKKIVCREVKDVWNDSQIPASLQRIYATRGIRATVDLNRSLEHLLPYHALTGIHSATTLLADAIQSKKHILIVGDFDADGATSTALAIIALRAMGAEKVSYLVPNRFEYGYGLTPEIVEVAARKSPDVIITVDNGISSVAGVATAKTHGISVIITDHHLPGDELPAADAIVNPNQVGDVFESKHLAGVGVIFYVMLALRAHLRETGWFHKMQKGVVPNLSPLLDLVALGTVADVACLDKNNRILVYQGLQRIRQGKGRPGIYALLTVAGRAFERVTANDLGYGVGPRLNAAGRLDDMSLGIECLIESELPKALAMASHLNDLNQERRLIEADMQQQALLELDKLPLERKSWPMGVCLFDQNWHQGVIGILASRIKDRIYRPVIIFSAANENELKGSARSIPGLHIRDVLDAVAVRCPHLISKFGGHAQAAGLTLMRENYPEFCHVFNEEVEKRLAQEDLHNNIYTDGELIESDLTLAFAELLNEAGPWGQAFPEPVFEGCFQILQQRRIAEKHLKLALCKKDGKITVEAIAFNVDWAEWEKQENEFLTIAYRLDVNEFRGKKSLQLVIEHMENA